MKTKIKEYRKQLIKIIYKQPKLLGRNRRSKPYNYIIRQLKEAWEGNDRAVEKLNNILDIDIIPYSSFK